ncbi:hypothetical protein JX265_001744 [Neoarthrinium moseri]|uniref:Uncharacterized protein n=1 Tax=Neoarthrinium moseri TaxID=1658444 RepID=A0A9P9WW08_9PEZI|nr:hypothetical protein JX265_001744 [Neoarthrinium moseri]
MSKYSIQTSQSRALLFMTSRVLVFLCLIIILVNVCTFESFERIVPTHTKALVVASSSATEKDAAWLARVPLDWSIYHYLTDKPKTPTLSVPVNRGNEAMVYLTYIIDHYETLPDVVFFHHDHYQAWHQPFDAIFEVSNLRASYVLEKGYVSPRCLSGCENIIQLADDAVDIGEIHLVPRDMQLRTFLTEFSNDTASIPDKIAAPCCAQFAASRDAIRQRSLLWWNRMRQWLIDTSLTSYNSGRLLEYTWHIWLGEQAQL